MIVKVNFDTEPIHATLGEAIQYDLDRFGAIRQILAAGPVNFRALVEEAEPEEVDDFLIQITTAVLEIGMKISMYAMALEKIAEINQERGGVVIRSQRELEVYMAERGIRPVGEIVDTLVDEIKQAGGVDDAVAKMMNDIGKLLGQEPGSAQ